MIFLNILIRYRVVNDSLFFIVASGEEKGIIEPGAVRTVNVSPNMTAIINNQHLFTRVLFTTNSLCTRDDSLTNIYKLSFQQEKYIEEHFTIYNTTDTNR